MKTLSLSKSLALPLDYVTSRNMVLAQSGAGKSNVCVVLAEEMHRNGIPWIAIDTKGDWYGVRSSRDGKGRGLDVPVFGGEFGDMPLSPLAGTRMAELAAAGKFSGVLDVSDFAKTSDVSRFLTDFANTLLKKQRTPLHLFLEECHDYLPQGGYRGQVDPLAAACVGAMKRLATKGRFRGIGYTLISQRAAEVNKTVLYQCETLIALRMVGDLDIKWIEGWVKRGSKRAAEILETLPDLRDGECWVWSPQRLKLTTRVQARRRETFDSGAAPEIGKARVAPKMAPVELEALRKELADLEAQAKADDPKELRKKIADLEKALNASQMATHHEARKKAAPTVLGDFEVIVDRRHLEEVIATAAQFEADVLAFEKSLSPVRVSANTTAAAVRRARETGPAALAKRLAKSPAPKRSADLLPPAPKEYPSAPSGLTPRQREARATASVGGTRDQSIGDSGLARIMIALAQRPEGLSRRSLGLRAGLSSRSGTFSTYLSRGRSAGWIDGKSEIHLTDVGIEALGPYEPLPTGDALFAYWLQEIGKDSGAGRMLGALASVYPDLLSRAELGEQANLGAASGTFSTYLSRLRGLELIEGKSDIRLSEELVG